MTSPSGFSTPFLALAIALLRVQATGAVSRVYGVLLLLVVGMDIATHTPRLNPTVDAKSYGPVELVMTPVPQLGMSRAMLSPPANEKMHTAGSPDPKEHFLVQRLALYSNCNLLQVRPVGGGARNAYSRRNVRCRRTAASS